MLSLRLKRLCKNRFVTIPPPNLQEALDVAKQLSRNERLRIAQLLIESASTSQTVESSQTPDETPRDLMLTILTAKILIFTF